MLVLGGENKETTRNNGSIQIVNINYIIYLCKILHKCVKLMLYTNNIRIYIYTYIYK